MPLKIDFLYLKDPFLDRRVKLLPCQREMIKSMFDRGASINGLARMYHVNKRLIQFIIFPERLKKNIELRNDRGGSKIYYDSQVNSEAVKQYRMYKKIVFPPVTLFYFPKDSLVQKEKPFNSYPEAVQWAEDRLKEIDGYFIK